MAGWTAIARGAFPTDCRKIVQMIEETDSLRLWEREIGGRGPWPDRDSFLADQVLLDPDLIQPVYDALLVLDPDHAIPIEEAVNKAKQKEEWTARREAGESYREIAKDVGVAPNTVKNRCAINTVITAKVAHPRNVIGYRITQYTKPETAADKIIEKFGADFAQQLADSLRGVAA
jgi:hypothetical protein